MSIDSKTIARVASLAMLEIGRNLPEAEKEAALEALTGKINAIAAGYLDILKGAATEGLEPLYSPVEEAAPPREDLPLTADSEKILAQSPDRIGNFFAVPKIL